MEVYNRLINSVIKCYLYFYLQNAMLNMDVQSLYKKPKLPAFKESPKHIKISHYALHWSNCLDRLSNEDSSFSLIRHFGLIKAIQLRDSVFISRFSNKEYIIFLKNVKSFLSNHLNVPSFPNSTLHKQCPVPY